MANLSLTRVNQKLNQAKVACTGAEASEPRTVQYQSAIEAASFHLVCAYQHYLRELAENYGLKMVASIRTEADLAAAFESANKYPAEVQELIALRREQGSWLANLHTYYESLWLQPLESKAQAAGNDSLIAVVNIEPVFDVLSVSLALVQGWQAAFSSLVIRQRATSAEF